jgi:hypothetical protein
VGDFVDYRGDPIAVDDRVRIAPTRTRRGVPAYLGGEVGRVASLGRSKVTVVLDRYPDRPWVVPPDVLARVHPDRGAGLGGSPA